MPVQKIGKSASFGAFNDDFMMNEIKRLIFRWQLIHLHSSSILLHSDFHLIWKYEERLYAIF